MSVADKFDRAIVVGALDPAGILPDAVPVERVSEASLAPGFEMSVEAAVQMARAFGRRDESLLVLTERDLYVAEFASLFGFADRRRRVVVLSAFHLRRDCDLSRYRLRMRNALAHELGHLAGLQHCANQACVMCPALRASDLDERADEPCGRCPSRWRWPEYRRRLPR